MRAIAPVLFGIASACGAPDIDDSVYEGDSPTVPGGRHLERPDTPGTSLVFAFAPDDTVETFDSSEGHIRVHFTRTGANAVPTLDSDADGTPDFVSSLAPIYEDVRSTYLSMGFREPLSDIAAEDNGGDASFDVYLVDFAGVGDGNFQSDPCNTIACPGFMIQENDFQGYGYDSTNEANRILASHEFFHAVQAAYTRGQSSIVTEGTAVWATEQFDATLDDLEAFSKGYLSNPDRSLNVPLPGPVDPFSYGSALFFQFLSERYSPDVVLALWEAVDGESDDLAWWDALGPVLTSTAKVGFDEAFTTFAEWNLLTGQAADPSRSYAAGASYPRVKHERVRELPFNETLRVFAASTQYFKVSSPPEALHVYLKDATALSLFTAIETNNGIAAAVRQPPGQLELDGRNADAVWIAIVNTAMSGDSVKPTLCLSSERCEPLPSTEPAPVENPDPAPAPPANTTADEDSGCGLSRARPWAPRNFAVFLLAFWVIRRRCFRLSVGAAILNAP